MQDHRIDIESRRFPSGVLPLLPSVFGLLDVIDWLNCFVVSRAFRNAANDGTIWPQMAARSGMRLPGMSWIVFETNDGKPTRLDDPTAIVTSALLKQVPPICTDWPRTVDRLILALQDGRRTDDRLLLAQLSVYVLGTTESYQLISQLPMTVIAEDMAYRKALPLLLNEADRLRKPPTTNNINDDGLSFRLPTTVSAMSRQDRSDLLLFLRRLSSVLSQRIRFRQSELQIGMSNLTMLTHPLYTGPTVSISADKRRIAASWLVVVGFCASTRLYIAVESWFFGKPTFWSSSFDRMFDVAVDLASVDRSNVCASTKRRLKWLARAGAAERTIIRFGYGTSIVLVFLRLQDTVRFSYTVCFAAWSITTSAVAIGRMIVPQLRRCWPNDADMYESIGRYRRLYSAKTNQPDSLAKTAVLICYLVLSTQIWLIGLYLDYPIESQRNWFFLLLPTLLLAAIWSSTVCCIPICQPNRSIAVSLGWTAVGTISFGGLVLFAFAVSGIDAVPPLVVAVPIVIGRLVLTTCCLRRMAS